MSRKLVLGSLVLVTLCGVVFCETPKCTNSNWKPTKHSGSFWAGTQEQLIFWTFGLVFDVVGLIGFGLLYRELKRNEVLRSTSVKAFYPMFVGNLLFLIGTSIVYSTNYSTVLNTNHNGCKYWANTDLKSFSTLNGVNQKLLSDLRGMRWYSLADPGLTLEELTEEIASEFETSVDAITKLVKKVNGPSAMSSEKGKNIFLSPTVSLMKQKPRTLSKILFWETTSCKKHGLIKAYANCEYKNWHEETGCIIEPMFRKITSQRIDTSEKPKCLPVHRVRFHHEF